MRHYIQSAAAIVALVAIVATPLAGAAEPGLASTQQMAELAGDYELSDGRRLEINFDGFKVYARLDKGPREKMRGTSNGEFSTLDGKILVRRKEASEDPAVEVRLRNRPELALR